MAIGVHWEWRGFGTVSDEFSKRFLELESLFPPQCVEDVYLWTAGFKINCKVRDLEAEPLKFKRLQAKDGQLEQWAENSEDILRFPLQPEGWDVLTKVFASADLTLGSYPGEANRETTLARLKVAGAQRVSTTKLRVSYLWQGPNGGVKVEWTCISSPQNILSIGLENWDDEDEGAGLPDELAKEDIHASIKELGLDKESLSPMNYLDAVAVWASGGEVISPLR
jgi:hypothetical protein